MSRYVWRVLVLTILLGACGLQSYGEEDQMRVWTRLDGRQFAGAYVREQLDKLFVRNPNGQVVSIPLAELSANDIKYIRTKVLPEVSVSVRSSKDKIKLSQWTFDMERVMQITLGIEVAKTSKPQFDGILSCDVIIVAQDLITARYFVLQKRTYPLVFTKENGEKAQFSAIAKVRDWDEYNNIEVRGYEYAGYILTVRGGLDNKIVKRETDLKRLEEGAVDKVAEYSEWTFFTETGRPTSVPYPKDNESRKDWFSF
jgi:hypothetical protein